MGASDFSSSGSAPESELNAKLLERALQQLDSARGNFIRDLKIAAGLLLAFQLLIFFRFVDADEEGARLEKQISLRQAEQTAVTDVQAQLASLNDALQAGQKKIAERLKETPSNLSEDIIAMNKELGEFRSETTASRREQVAALVSQTSQQGGATGRFLTGLSEQEIGILKTAAPDQANLKDLIRQIVRRKIIEPRFAALNTEKAQVLTGPFLEGANRLAATLKERDSVLEKLDLKPKELESTVTAIGAQVTGIHYTAPASDAWWKTVEDKTRTLQVSVQTTDAVLAILERDLGRPERELASFNAQLASLLQQSKVQRDKLNEKVQELQSANSKMQSLLADFAKPFSFVALEARDAVLQFPLILAVVCAWFTLRFVLLLRKSLVITDAYRKRGLSEEVLRIYFQEGANFSAVSRGFLLAALAIPGVFLAVSIWRILTSSTLASVAPGGAFATAGFLLILAYVVLASSVLRFDRIMKRGL